MKRENILILVPSQYAYLRIIVIGVQKIVSLSVIHLCHSNENIPENRQQDVNTYLLIEKNQNPWSAF
jgi:hypothetical protein